MCFTWGSLRVCLLVAEKDLLVFWTAVYALAAVGTLAVLGVAAWVAYRQLALASQQLREAVESRHAQMLLELSRRWDEPTLVASRRLADQHGDQLADWVRHYFETGDEKLFELERVPNFFEDAALVSQLGGISYELLEKSLGGNVVAVWNQWEESIRYMRHLENDDPRIFENFEALAKRLMEEEEIAKGPPT